MPADRGNRRLPLTLVTSASSSRAEPSRASKARNDWSVLMAQAQDGDRHAYRVLLEDVTPYLRALASRCFGDPSDVEDAVQDVLLAIHAMRNTYDPARPFGPWLVAIAKRRMIDRLRRRARDTARKIALAAEQETFQVDATNFQHAEPQATIDAALREAIERLPSEQRQAVELLKLREMSLKDAAALTGRSVAALKVATHRAIKSLRTALRKESEER
jgi:RNA polymerase sigma-70 factor (ECF subfamily)